MVTANDIINQALILNGDIDASDTPNANDSALALSFLNDIFEELSLDDALAFSTKRYEFNLNANQNTYTFGVGGDFDLPIPIAINNASIIYNNFEYPIRIATLDEYQNLWNKDITDYTNQIPSWIYTDNQLPLSNLRVYPTPSDALSKLILYLRQPLNNITDTALGITLPLGYKGAIQYRLAYQLSLANSTPKAYLQVEADRLFTQISSNINTTVYLMPNNRFLGKRGLGYGWWNGYEL